MTKQEKFIQKAKKLHSGKYTYDKSTYISNTTNLIITCPKHGDFNQSPKAHLQGSGCRECSKERLSKKYSMGVEEFIKKANKVHDSKYDYSKTIYKATSKKVTIICPEHGEFEQMAGNHLRGFGCNRCNGYVDCADGFIEKSIRVHGHRYDYSKVKYANTITKVDIICPEHGIFSQAPNGHMEGKGCNKCASNVKAEKFIMSENDFIARAIKVHGNTYDYSKVDYKGAKEKITIICPEHGEFEQLAGSHIRGSGCSSCAGFTSLEEKELSDFLKEHIDIETSNRKLIAPLELDIVIPSKKIAIEFNGLYWHQSRFVGKDYHDKKSKLCKEKGYQLIHVWDDDWKNRKDVVKNMLLHKIGKSTQSRIFARKCEVKHLIREKDFFDLNHIQGHTSGRYISLYHDGEVVASIIYKNTALNTKNKGMTQIIRYATNANVIGGFSKLSKHLQKLEGKPLLTFSDNCISDGGLYENNGFTNTYDIPIDYMYVENMKREHKFNYRLKNLKERFGITGLTEKQATEQLNIHRVHDCGKKAWVKNII